MRLVIFSDLHVHAWAAYSQLDSDGVNTRLKDTLKVLEIVRDTARDEYADAVIFAGDLFHVQKIDAEVLALTGKALEGFGELACPVLAIEGNHDQASRVRELTSTSALRIPKNWKWLRASSVTIKGYTIWGAPFGHEELPDVDADVAVMHRGIHGATISDYFQSPFEHDLNPEDASKYASRLVIAGHYHRPQKIDSPTPILVPGSPLQHTWGDMGEDRGIWVIDITDDYDKYDHGIKTEFRPLSFPKFVRVTRKEDLDQVAGNFVELDIKEPVPDEVLDKARSFSMKAAQPQIIRPIGERLEVGSNLEGAIHEYATRFGADRAKDLEKLGLDLLKLARNS